MSEPARFELVEGATFQLSDGSTVTVRDGQLELSDGRRLPMPAAGEAITVEKTVTRPDGGTTRIKHTIRLSEAEPVVASPARPFAGAGPGPDEDVGETVPVPEGDVVTNLETAPAAVPVADGDASPAAETAETTDKAENGAPGLEEVPAAAAEVPDGQLPEVPSQDPASPIVTTEPVLMGVNCGRRSLREMLWGSIPESGFGEDEDEPKAPPKGLLNPSYSIKEEDESEHEDGEEAHEEALESSENADESFEFVEGKGKEAEKEKEPEKENKPEETPAQQAPADSVTKVTVLEFDVPKKSESSPVKADEETNNRSPKEPESQTSTPEATEEGAKETPPENSNTELSPEATATTTTTPSDRPANDPADHPHDKPYLTRQDKHYSSGNLVAQAGDGLVVRVGVPLFDADDSKPADSEARLDSPESTASPSSDSAAPAAGSRSDEVHHDLHLKLTPILRSLESDKPKSESGGGDGERDAKPAPSEDRKGTVPPNTPAVVEDRDGILGGEEPDADTVSVPKVVSYYESISPRASPAPARPRDSETSAVPKMIKFAVPMEPQKVYLGSQEPEEMEDTPIPRAVEQPGRVLLAPEPAAYRQEARQVLVPVRGTPDDLDPLAAPAAKPDEPTTLDAKPDEPATPETTPEKETTPEDTTPEKDTTPGDTDRQAAPDANAEKPRPPVYNPALFEPEPKRPLILTSEMVEEPGSEEHVPPYEPGVHDSRTLPMGRKTAVVTEQPPPFGEDDRTDPTDPFLPDHPRPGAAVKEDGWLSACFDLCCCCWAP